MPASSHLLPQHTPQLSQSFLLSSFSVPNPLPHILLPWLLTTLSLQLSFQCHLFQKDFPEPPDWCGYHISATPSQCLRYYYRNVCLRINVPSEMVSSFFSPLHHAACGIIVPHPGSNLRALSSEGNLRHSMCSMSICTKQRRPSCTRLLFKCQQVAKSKLPSRNCSMENMWAFFSGRKDGSFDLWLSWKSIKLSWFFCHSKSGERCHLVCGP